MQTPGGLLMLAVKSNEDYRDLRKSFPVSYEKVHPEILIKCVKEFLEDLN